MKKMVISSRFLDNLCHKEQVKNFRNRIKKMKSTLSLNNQINNNNKLCPIKLNSFRKNFSSNYLENIKNKFNSNELKLRIFTIAQDNLIMYKKLLDCRNNSTYDKKSLIKGYNRNQCYKKIACEYPSIDFYKNKRIEKYYQSLNNKNNKIQTFFNNLDKYLKPKKIDINKYNYGKLFFSNEIKNEYNFSNKKNKNKLILDSLIKNITPKKHKQYFKTNINFNGKLEDKFSEMEKG